MGVKVKRKQVKPSVEPVVKRFPIMLNNHTVMVVHLFTRFDRFEDFWMHGFSNGEQMQKEAAGQLLSQLEDEWTPLFLMELRAAITKKLKEHDAAYGTSFA